jgi:hypothetical protein
MVKIVWLRYGIVRRARNLKASPTFFDAGYFFNFFWPLQIIWKLIQLGSHFLIIGGASVHILETNLTGL